MMSYTKDQELAIALIKNDYINYCLVAGLNALGIEASLYYTRLYEPICTLLGLERNELVYEQYFDLMSQTERVDLSSEMALDEVAEGLYRKLMRRVP